MGIKSAAERAMAAGDGEDGKIIRAVDASRHPLESANCNGAASDDTAGTFDRLAGSFTGVAGGFIQTGKSVIRTAGGSSHTDRPFIHTVEGASHTHKSSNHTHKSFIRMAEGFIHTYKCSRHTNKPSNHTHKSFIRMVERFIHTHKCSNHTNKPSSQTNKSFIGAGKWSSRTGFAPKPAESGKKDPFSRSDHARWSKIDSGSQASPNPPRNAWTAPAERHGDDAFRRTKAVNNVRRGGRPTAVSRSAGHRSPRWWPVSSDYFLPVNPLRCTTLNH